MEVADGAIKPMVERIVAHWQADWRAAGPPSNKTLSLDRLRLHDGLLRRASYIVRTWLLPKPHSCGIGGVACRIELGIYPHLLVHDTLALPLYRTYEYLTSQNTKKKDKVASDVSKPKNAAAWAKQAQEFLDGNRLTEAIEANAHALALDPGQHCCRACGSMFKRCVFATGAIGKTTSDA